MDRQTQDKLLKFFDDPDWVLVEDIIKEYIAPLRLAETINLKQDSSAVHAELKANLAAYAALERFLLDAGMMKKRNQKPDVFK